MSAKHDPIENALPAWVSEALRQPVTSRAESRSSIMDRVRGLPAPRRHSAPMRPSRWLRRGWLSPMGGFLTTTLLAVVVLMRSGSGAGVTDLAAVTRVLGDTVVPARAVAAADRWLDTMRIVEFVIRGSSIHAAAVLGDFNQWRRGATPLAQASPNEWRARVLIPRALAARDALEVAYLVNSARMIPASLRPHAPRARPD